MNERTPEQIIGYLAALLALLGATLCIGLVVCERAGYQRGRADQRVEDSAPIKADKFIKTGSSVTLQAPAALPSVIVIQGIGTKLTKLDSEMIQCDVVPAKPAKRPATPDCPNGSVRYAAGCVESGMVAPIMQPPPSTCFLDSGVGAEIIDCPTHP